MPDPATPRRYHSPLRTERASRTRASIVEAAHDLLVSEGFTRTTVHEIAKRARVNVDTIYRSIGRKPEVLRAVVESALSGTSETVPAQERDYVLRIRDAQTAGEKIDIYAAVITRIQQRLAPVFIALREAAHADDESRRLWTEISERRARNMREFAADLQATGELRDDLDNDEIADIIWSMNGTEYWLLLVDQRQWSPDRFRRWISDAWRRLLLA